MMMMMGMMIMDVYSDYDDSVDDDRRRWYMMMMIGNDRWWLWCDSNDGCDCDDELLCHRIRKTMMMMMYGLLVCIFLSVDRYKYVCVHYQ